MEVGFWEQFFGLSLLFFFAFLTYSSIKQNPSMFSAFSLNKSFKTMGILALILIAFVTFLIIMTPQGAPTSQNNVEKIVSSKPTKNYRSI
jgi:hypothetical protein